MSPPLSSLCVVVPWHNPHQVMGPDGQLAIARLHAMLGARYRIMYAGPQSQVRGGLAFPDQWFTSVAAYSCLMLSRGFYDRLACMGYEWVLIHQLDALLLHGALQAFADPEWAYVGAPIPPGLIGGAYALNGGLSLRHVPTFRELAPTDWHPLAEPPPSEDLAWSVILGPRLAPLEVALAFSWECGAPDYAAQGYPLPFGCHAWRRRHPDFWLPIIASLPGSYRQITEVTQ